MKTVPTTKKTAQPMKMSPVPTQPIKCTNDTENTPENYKPETMDNNTVDEITGMGDAG